jgi:uncharacterized membrane protein YdjX (TVP38/TMEM64 family)
MTVHDPPSAARGSGLTERPAAAGLSKPLTLLATLLVAVAVIYLSPLGEYVAHLREATEDLRRAGSAAPLIFAGLVAVLVAVGFPRLLFCAAGGLAFGFSQGFVWSQVGTVAGCYATFAFVRWGGRDFVLQRFPRLDAWRQVIHRQGIPAVVLARQLPVPTFVCNLLLGLLPVRHSHFVVGTMIGVVPEAVPCTLIGSGAVSGSLAHSAAAMSAAVVALALVWLGSAVYARTLTKPDLAMARAPRSAAKELDDGS